MQASTVSFRFRAQHADAEVSSLKGKIQAKVDRRVMSHGSKTNKQKQRKSHESNVKDEGRKAFFYRKGSQTRGAKDAKLQSRITRMTTNHTNEKKGPRITPITRTKRFIHEGAMDSRFHGNDHEAELLHASWQDANRREKKGEIAASF